MIPLRDDAPRWTTPYVTRVLIGLNVLVFLYQFTLYLGDPRVGDAFVQGFGSVPAKISAAFAGRYPVDAAFLPVFTSMFLHGGWLHLIGNMWFLSIFGDNIEDELGHLPYLLFYLTCGVIASVAHYLANPLSVIPAVGASGAISGVMGAYMVRFPWARIVTLIPLFFFFTTIELPAVIMLFYWFFIQFASGAASLGMEGGGVAWWAHIGGFVAGAVWIWTRPRRRRRQPQHVFYY